MKCTAYVTLEPCSHYGKTPPCATSLKLAGIDRVVIGYPDINPKVNGGGVKLLQDAGVHVDILHDENCYKMIEYFLNRISTDRIDYDSVVDNGKKRRVLRSEAGRRKANQTLMDMSITVPSSSSSSNDNNWLPSSAWLEKADGILWQQELLLLRISATTTSANDKKRNIVSKIGEDIGKELNAYVAQKLGHTILLYRPSKIPVISFESE